MKPNRLWLVYALITTIAWGTWGAFIDKPAESSGPGDPVFPATLSYIVWSLTMIPPAIVALWLIRWRLDTSSSAIAQGMTIGILGAAGQLVLFPTLSMAPAYLVFPFIALSPLVTILLAALISRERVHTIGALGVALAIVAGVLLSVEEELVAQVFGGASESAAEVAAGDELPAAAGEEGEGVASQLWVVLALLVLLAWGVQGFLFSYANRTMKAESIFFYMMVSGILLAPVGWYLTDFSEPIDWGWSGPGLAASIQILNAVGALLIVYAFRYGKAMLVAPLTNAGAPVITIVLSLILTASMPGWVKGIGMVLAVVAALLMTMESEAATPVAEEKA